MNQENFDHLKESLFKKGFGTELNAQLEDHLKKGTPEFSLEHFTKAEKDEIGYKVHFRRDDDQSVDRVYLNAITVGLFHNADRPGEVREHTFSADKLITAMEAYRMLKYGDAVAVNKNLFNKDDQKYNTWITIDVNGVKDDKGNYPVNTYHENYYKKRPFDVLDQLKSFSVPLKELENKLKLPDYAKMLAKAFLIPVKAMIDGRETAMFLGVNARKGSVELYDSFLQPYQSTALKAAQSQQQSFPQAEGEKKFMGKPESELGAEEEQPGEQA